MITNPVHDRASEALVTTAGPDAAPDQRDRSCMAMVIAFNPEARFTRLVASLTAQFDAVVIVDNGDAARTAALLTALPDRSKLTHIPLGDNLGIGAALNRALRHAEAAGFAWMVSFDHDSLVRDDYRAALFEGLAASDASAAGIAVIGPVWHRLGGAVDFSRQLDRSQDRHVVVPSVITSGSCVAVAVAAAIGGFDETLFIDSVDQEFCLRARSRGYRIVVDRALLMDHQLGAEREVRFLGKRLVVTDHSPIRRYYIARNKLFLWRSFLRVYPRWVITDLKWHAVEVFKVLAFERDRGKKLLAILLGNLHGLLGVKQRIPPLAARLLST